MSKSHTICVPVVTAALLLVFFLGCSQPKYEVRNRSVPQPIATSSTLSFDCDVLLPELGGCLQLKWLSGPQLGADDRLLVLYHRPNQFGSGRLIVNPDPSHLSVVLSMPSMGHGTDPTKVIHHDIGTYEVQNIFFSMSGRWRIEFQFKNDNGPVQSVGLYDVVISE